MIFIPYKQCFFLRLSLLFLTPAIALFSISCIHHQNHHAYHSPSNQQEVGKSPLNKVIRDLSFFPINDYRFRLSELKDIKAIVFVMREKDCPISEKYGVRLTQLEEKYSKQGIKFIYVYVGQVDIQESAKSDLEKFGFKGAYVVDSKQRIINTLFAKTTGDVFVLTPERKVIYRGPVDDQYHILQQVPKAKNHYLFDVLQNVVSGKKVIPKELSAPGCFISRPLVKEKVFYKDVAPIIYNKCTSCHNPEGTGLMNFTSYEDIVGRGAMFKYVIENDLMPPWYVDPNTGPWKDDLSLTVKEKAMLLKWVNSGFSRKAKTIDLLQTAWVEKNKKLDKKIEASGDYVITLPEKVEIPADKRPEMFSDYKTFIIPTDFNQDKWINNIKVVLKPKVIHHLHFFAMNPSLSSKELAKIIRNYDEIVKNSVSFFGVGSLTTYIYDMFKHFKDVGVFLPRQGKIVLVIHYENYLGPDQDITDDYTHIKLSFHKKKPKYKMVNHVLSHRTINIPPYKGSYKSILSHKLKETRRLIAFGTHMHYRGVASSLFLSDSKGRKKRIFGLDPFTIKFTGIYGFKKPLFVSKDSTLECINWFDNSTKNKQNPNPSEHVIFGVSTQKEMSQCYFWFLVPIDSQFKTYFSIT